MADCTLPNAWNLPACAKTLPVMDTSGRVTNNATGSNSATSSGTNPAASIPRPGAPGTVITGSGFPWWLLAVGVGVYAMSRKDKKGLNGTDDEDTGTDAPVELNGPRRRKPRPAPVPAPRPAPKPRTHGQHRATLVIH